MTPRKHLYPAADPNFRPSHLWYWGRAVYVSRYDYWRITKAFLAVGLPTGIGGLVWFHPLFRFAEGLAAVGVALLIYSLVGLYRMYAAPSMRYYAGLVHDANLTGSLTIADLHIGTYRTSYALAELLPAAQIYSVDCWNVEGPPPEPAIADVRDLEPQPQNNVHIVPLRASEFSLPLEDETCDAVVFGFGTHEIPVGSARDTIFAEAKRVLKLGGKVLLFEHGKDLHNFIIFGPVIKHVTDREQWLELMGQNFADIKYRRSSAAVDLITGVRA